MDETYDYYYEAEAYNNSAELEAKYMSQLNTKIGTATELVSELLYSSYLYNRDCGMTHDQLISIGLGNNSMKVRYEKDK